MYGHSLLLELQEDREGDLNPIKCISASSHYVTSKMQYGNIWPNQYISMSCDKR